MANKQQKQKNKKVTIFLMFLGLCIVAFLALLFFRSNTSLVVMVKVGDDNVLYTSPGVKPWFSELFHEGMEEKNGIGKIMAKVLKVQSFNYLPNNDYNYGERLSALYLTVKLTTVYNRATRQYTYKGKTIATGQTIRLYLDNVLTEGLITHIDGMHDTTLTSTITIEAKLIDENATFQESAGVFPYIADMISIGQEVKDPLGQPIIKIIDSKISDAKRLYVLQDGRPIITSNPLKKDVTLTLELKAVKRENIYYVFDDISILVGKYLPCHFPFYSIYPEITKIISIQE